MASTASVARPGRIQSERAQTALSLGLVTAFLSAVVVLPIAAVVWQSRAGGISNFWTVVSSPEAVSALELSIIAALL